MKFYFNDLTAERFNLATEILKGKPYFYAV